MFVLLHGAEGGLDLTPVLIGALVAVAIWYVVRRLSTSQRTRGGDGW